MDPFKYNHDLLTNYMLVTNIINNLLEEKTIQYIFRGNTGDINKLKNSLALFNYSCRMQELLYEDTYPIFKNLQTVTRNVFNIISGFKQNNEIQIYNKGLEEYNKLSDD